MLVEEIIVDVTEVNLGGRLVIKIGLCYSLENKIHCTACPDRYTNKKYLSSRSGYMTGKNKNRRVSKADWLEKALEVLENEGIDEVKIERLAKELKISRSGFYWHFENRQALIRAMIEYWGEEFTSVVTSNKELLNAEPKERLYMTMEMIFDHNLIRFELPMRVSAEKDPVAMKLINRIYQQRTDFLRSTFADIGFEGEELEMRTHLFVCYHMWEDVTFGNLSKAKRSKWLKLRCNLLCSPIVKSIKK